MTLEEDFTCTQYGDICNGSWREQSRQRKGTGIPGRKASGTKPYRQKKQKQIWSLFLEMLGQFDITVVLDDLSEIIKDEPRKKIGLNSNYEGLCIPS